ncbi:MAG: hypothetical protein H0T47_08055 [Planctomycetaceae bacterium]|nr:hypothetical protein [Planctomycetaceae bacterium]
MTTPRPRYHRWFTIGAATTLSACGIGCALLDTGGWSSVGLTSEDRQTLLKPIEAVAPDALRLEYVLIERPAGDPLIGSELWDELAEMGVVDHSVRSKLNSNGIRVGIASTSPPHALQKLLGDAKEIIDAEISDEARRRHGQMLLLPTGSQTEAQTSDYIDSYRLNVTVDGKPTPKTFEQVRGVFRVTASSKQDGWATFEFMPEIRHGASQTRPVPGDAGWKQFETGQSVQKLYDQKFELRLVEGEAAVVTSMADVRDVPGELFFRTTVDGVPVQRLLVVRLLRTGEKPTRQ